MKYINFGYGIVIEDFIVSKCFYCVMYIIMIIVMVLIENCFKDLCIELYEI